VRAALNAPLQVHETLVNGFWPTLRVTIDEVDCRKRASTLCEGNAEDAPFVGCNCDHPQTLFYINCDTFASYFVVVHLIDGDLKPLWLARAIRNTNSDPGHMNMI